MQYITVYRSSGETYMFRSGAAPGRITYADGKPGVYLPPEEKRQFRIEVDPVNNRLIDIPGQGIDTICDPVIVEDLKMILSPDDYRIFREQVRLPEKAPLDIHFLPIQIKPLETGTDKPILRIG